MVFWRTPPLCHQLHSQKPGEEEKKLIQTGWQAPHWDIFFHTLPHLILTIGKEVQFSSVQSLGRVQLLWPHGLQQAGPPCPSPSPGVYPNSCPLRQWCHSTISSSVIPLFSQLQSFPGLGSGSFQMSQLFISGGQIIGVSASASSFQWIFRTDFL